CLLVPSRAPDVACSHPPRPIMFSCFRLSRLVRHAVIGALGLFAIAFALPAAASEPSKGPSHLALKPGAHICLIGNTLADRMQHDGWLETLLHARFPEHHLVIRNLGFSGDELTLRLRSFDFGTP